MGRPTAFPNGLTDIKTGVARNFPFLYEPKFFKNYHDFHRYDPDQWATVNTGSGTVLLNNAEVGGNGAVTLTTSGASSDKITAQWKGDPGRSVAVPDVLINNTKSAYFTSRFFIDDLTSMQFIVGLLPANTAPFAAGVPAPLVSVTNGAYFAKSGNNLVFVMTKAGVSTVTTVGVLTNLVYVKAEFNYNDGKVEVWINNALIASLPTTNFPDANNLALTKGLINTAAAARSLRLDFLGVYAEAPTR